MISSPLAVAPRIRVAPPAARNDAAEVVDLMAAYGVALDDWQIDALEVGCGVGDDGRWAAPTVGLNLSRQNGKSLLLISRALAGAVLFSEPTIILSAHQQATSRQLFRTLAGFFENYDSLRKRVKAVSAALGREQIELRSGARVAFPARTRQTLRGWTVDTYLCDEAQLISDDAWESAKPALSAVANPAVWLAGTAPQLVTDGQVFGRLRESAIAGRDRVGWIEYGAAEGCDLDDRDEWTAANPGRVEVTAMEAERRELTDRGFSTERLNHWPTDRVKHIFGPGVWESLASAGPPDGTPPAALAVDASPQRALAIAGAWLIDGSVHVELLAADYASDPLNALQFVVERAGRRIPVVIDGVSPAASMVPLLKAQRCKVIVTSAPDMGRACGGFVDDVDAARLSHAGQPQLDAAVEGARKRPIAVAGAFGWDRADGGVFIAPLVAVTLARHGAVTAARSGRATFV